MTNSRTVSLNYGGHGCFSCAIEDDRILASRAGPAPHPRLREGVASALSSPLDFPPLDQAVIPDDRVVLALEQHTPSAATLVAGIWDVLEMRAIKPRNLSVLQPPPLRNNGELSDPRRELPADVRREVEWKVHDPEERGACVYLASTLSGERIYLARDVVDADVVVSVGHIGFDPILGYRGTHSVFFPGLSSSDALRRARGQGHVELGPDDDRPMRQLVDEVGWLLGTQFSVQVTPAAGDAAAHVIAGAADSVFRRGKQLLAEDWLFRLDSRPDVVVAAVETDTAGHGWEQVCAALATARCLVANGGKVLLLSELQAQPGRGIDLIREQADPRDAIQPLRQLAPDDLIPATQLAGAVDWADVYLLSGLECDVVEELFMTPLADEKEVERLLAQADLCVFVQSAQHSCGQVT